MKLEHFLPQWVRTGIQGLACVLLLLVPPFLTSLFCSYLYQIAHLGDDDDEPEFSSAMPLEEGDTFFFAPRQLKNLVLVDELESLSPILGCHIADLGVYNQTFNVRRTLF